MPTQMKQTTQTDTLKKSTQLHIKMYIETATCYLRVTCCVCQVSQSWEMIYLEDSFHRRTISSACILLPKESNKNNTMIMQYIHSWVAYETEIQRLSKVKSHQNRSNKHWYTLYKSLDVYCPVSTVWSASTSDQFPASTSQKHAIRLATLNDCVNDCVNGHVQGDLWWTCLLSRVYSRTVHCIQYIHSFDNYIQIF